MTPEQFLQKIARGSLAPVYLFLGPEAYSRKQCREALLNRALPAGARAEGLSQFDLENTTLAEILDDARSLSLFSSARVLWVASAELALPRRLAASSDDDENGDGTADKQLAQYIQAPTVDAVIVLECSRYDFSGDDRQKIDRVAKFYSRVPVTVEFRPHSPESSRMLAQQLAKQHGLQIGNPELAILLDAVAGDASRLASEMEKLALYVEPGRPVTSQHLQTMVPNAAQSTIFGLVNALARRDRMQALHSLDILVREGEYLPLALTFLSTQFRLALAAKEARITSSQQAQTFFSKLGVRMWRDRAEQVIATATAFSPAHLAKAVALIYETDKKFREGYRDDRVVMETLVFALTT